MADLGKVGNKVANIATLGAYDPLRKLASGNANEYRADEGGYDPSIAAAQRNNLTLQDALLAQMNGGGPNLAQQQFQNATQQLQNQAAGQIGSIKGISPAAQARLLSQQTAQIGQGLAGESALQRMQQQMLAQQMLGQNSLGMFDVASGRKLGAQQVNAGVTAANTQAQSQLVGGALSGAGAAAGMGGKAAGGYIEPADGPQSELGRALAGMSEGGPVFMADGGVPGRAPVPGDSPANDIVPAALSPGEIVIPRSSAGSPEAAASFVEALQRSQGGGYGAVVKARSMCGGGQAYAEGGEVEAEEPSLAQRAAKWWETNSDEAREALVGSVADMLPDALGGKVRKQVGAHKARIDAAGEE
jgi:hypothetical protein